MKKLVSLARLLPPLLVSSAALKAAGPAVPLGTMERFWRHSPSISPFTETGYSLIEIPAYMKRGDFPYPCRPYAKEVPFADHLTMVRILGGHKEPKPGSDGKPADRAAGDLAYRGADGQIAFRRGLLEARLRHYLENGYDHLTIVLDNVPWCFPAEPVNGGLGQSAPPRDLVEWRGFIETFCRELLRIAGPERAANFRFRLGTEMNGKERFHGTPQEFVAFFDATAAGVRAVFPQAPFSIFNAAGVSLRSMDRMNVNPFAVAEHVFEEGRFDQPKPFAWLAFSRYYSVWDDIENKARGAIEVWDEFDRRFPAAGGIPREIHEFGVAPFGEVARGRFPSAEPGALGAAMTSQMMWHLHEGGIDRLWHWTVYDRIRDRANRVQNIFTGDAWALLVFEAMAGGKTWRLPLMDPPPPGSSVLVNAALKPDAAYIMASAFHREEAQANPRPLRFRLPAEWNLSADAKISFVRFNRNNAPHDSARKLLLEAGLLKADFVERPGRLGNFHEMSSGDDGRKLLADHLADFESQWVDSLTLRPLDSSVGTVEPANGGALVTVNVDLPEVLVLKIGPR
jgi:hypothetical protein